MSHVTLLEQAIGAVVKDNDWTPSCGAVENGQYIITFKRGEGEAEQTHEVALNVSRLDPKAGEARKHWIEATRKTLAETAARGAQDVAVAVTTEEQAS